MSTDTVAWAQIQRWFHGVHVLFSQLQALHGAKGGGAGMKSRHGLVRTRGLMVGCALVRETTGNIKHFIPITVI